MSDKMSKPHHARTDVPCLYCIFDEQGHRVRACPGCITRMKLAPPIIVESAEEKRRETAELRARVTALEGTVATLRAALEIAQDILRDRCDHGHRCPKNEASQNLWATPDIIDAVPCECGLTQALEKVP